MFGKRKTDQNDVEVSVVFAIRYTRFRLVFDY